ncbi:hypothetical protein SUDANB121_05895 (plasmid) [Nocardiopsis dassonvillei]|uniref:hypothetical protein n=1 Tax=Nocardiopsis dassonvillei TaxID=2014 RepID=UPI003F5534B9
MRKNKPTFGPVAAPVMRGCQGCDWEIWSDSAVVAELEQAAHRVEAHATLPERLQIQHLVASYRELLGDLPGRLLVMAVHHVLDGSAPLALAGPACGEGAAA